VTLGNGDQLACHPHVVVLGELQSGQRILPVRIEAGGDENQFRLVAFKRRQPVVDDGVAELRAAAACRERNVDHVRCRVVDTRIRIQRVLERRHHQHTRIAGEHVLRAVAVVNVEVDDRHPR
jgi:hypothetical protein